MTALTNRILRTLTLAALLAGAAFALAACGDSPAPTAAPPTAPPATAAPGGAATDATAPPGGGKTNTIEIKLFEWAIEPKDTTIPPGMTTFKVTNTGKFPHNYVVLNGSTVLVRSNTLNGGAAQEITMDIPAGTYTTLCDLPGHADRGMKGTLSGK